MGLFLEIVKDHPMASVVVAGAVWFGWRAWRLRRIDRQFFITVNGGRDGRIFLRAPDLCARADYEVGRTVDFLIYGSSLAALDGRELTPSERAQMMETLAKWGKARGAKIAIEDDSRHVPRAGA